MSEENNWNYENNDQNVNQGNPVNLEKSASVGTEGVNLEKTVTVSEECANTETDMNGNPYQANMSYGNGSTGYNYGQPNGSAGYNYGQPNGSAGYNYGQPNGNAGYNYGQPNGSVGYNYGQQNGNNLNKKSESEGFGIASLVLGIITVLLFCTCISWITGILAIIFGIIQLVKGNKKGMAIVGLITGGIGFVASVILYILIFFTGFGSYSNYDDIYDHIYDDIYDDIENSVDDGTI